MKGELWDIERKAETLFVVVEAPLLITVMHNVETSEYTRFEQQTTPPTQIIILVPLSDQHPERVD
jgi:hypothetical protein